MDDAKLEPSVRPNEPPASYKAIPETDMEEEAVTRPKSLVKSKPNSPEVDGADEKMLPKEEKIDVKNEKQNGDAKLDIGELKSAFVGLTKEELMKYANDPFWVRLRWFLFITFWILWGMMLLGAIMIILAAPKCDPPPPRTWWQKGPLVEISQSLDDKEMRILKEEGATGVIVAWADDAYAEFDENHDFVETLKKYRELELNVIVDLEPGSSKIWFEKSESKIDEFLDYYVWKQPKSVNNEETPEPPNNWLTTNNTSSWIFSQKRKEFYYAPAGKPHLNLRNPNVTEKFSNVLKKFLKHGVGGVRLRGVPFLLVDPTFTDEEIDRTSGSDYVLTEYGFYTHTKTENVKDLGPLLHEWKIIVKNNTENVFMAFEDTSKSEAYRVNNSFVFDFPVQSDLFTKSEIGVQHIVRMISLIFDSSNATWPLWKCNSTEALDIVTYLLPGTPQISQGTSVKTDLLKQRNSPSIMRGIFSFSSVNNDTVFAFIRVAAGNPGILVALNPTENRTVVDFPATFRAISDEVTVLLFSDNYNEPDVAINVKQNAHKIPISPNSAIVLSYVPPTD